MTKGNDREDDGYSAFEGQLANGETLDRALREAGITRVYVGGLATDYCVLHTILDARRAGLAVVYLAGCFACGRGKSWRRRASRRAHAHRRRQRGKTR